MSLAIERIAVTGVGIVSALGSDAPSSFRELLAGRVGFRPLTRFAVEGFRSTNAAEVDLEVADVAPRHAVDTWSRSDAMALVAAREALQMAGAAADEEPISVAIGASTAGMREAETVLDELSGGVASRAAARKLLSFPLSATADRIRESLGRVERAVTICSACSSGANAALVGAAWLRRGQARRVLVGGTDALCLLTFAGFNSLGATDPLRCRPFDAERQGLTLGEGAAFLVLESESTAVGRNATVLAWLTGWAGGAEAHHLTQPEPSGAVAARLIRAALDQAGLDPTDIDYVNAHGTGTLHNDAMESRALAEAFGGGIQRVWVSSSKGQVGHTLAAAGAVEAAITILALAEQQLPPSGGLSRIDDALPKLRHVTGQGRAASIDAALTSSFGFGGTGVVLAFERATVPSRTVRGGVRKAVVTGALTWGRGGMRTGHSPADYLTASGPEDAGDARPSALGSLDPDRSRRFDEAAAVVALSTERILAAASLEPEEVGLTVGTAFGAVQRSVQFVERVVRRGPRLASPAEFPHLVPSAASGNASIYTGATGPVMAVSDLTAGAEAAACVADALMQLGVTDAVVAGAVAPMDPLVSDVLGPICSDRWGPRAGDGAGWVLLEVEELARRRGAEVLADLVFLDSGSEPGRLVAAVPGPGRRALVALACAGADDATELDESPWGAIPRRSVELHAGWHDALGGVALAAAAAAVARGDADEVLVWTRRATHWYAALLRQPAAGGPLAGRV